MKPGNFKVSREGECLYATIAVKPTISLKILLYALNILLISIIVLFTIGGIGIIVLFILVFEILFLRYSIWNIYGSETITLNRDTLSHQQHYWFINLPVKTLNIRKSIRVIPFHEDFKASSTMKLIFESFDDRDEPVNLYQTALVISKNDYHLFMRSFNELYLNNVAR